VTEAVPLRPATDRRYRLAIVGAGLISARSHLPTALACPSVEVTAIVDPDLARAREMVQAAGIEPRLATTLDEVLATVDAAVIAAPNHLHCPLAITALRAGIHTLVEKPIALNEREAESMAEAASKAGKVLSVGFQTRFRDANRLMKKLLAERHFGVVRRFIFRFGTAGGWAPASGYVLDRSKAGGGVLVVAGSHILERMIDWFGYPARSEYADDSQGGPEANCIARFHFDGGLEGLIQLSKTVKLDSGFAAETDAGVVTLADSGAPEIVVRSPEHPEREMVIRGRERQTKGEYLLQLEDFVAACRGGRIDPGPLRRAVAAQRLTDELYGARRSLQETESDQGPRREAL
jgi:predicted dehydrogenase